MLGAAGSTSNGTCTGCGRGPLYPNGTLDDVMISGFSRTYAQAVSGVTSSMFYNATDSTFMLTFLASPAIAQPTEIYFNEAMHYPQGYKCVVIPATAGKCVYAGVNTLHVHNTLSAATNVTISLFAL